MDRGVSTARILFVGNSFTLRNDLPSLWSGLAAADGEGTHIESQVVAVGGATLRQHLNKGEATALLNEEPWDFVVLQEQSTLPIKNPQRTGENILDFHALVSRTEARTVLYMTWARLNAPETQATLASTYDDIGTELGVTVVPAGLAWQRALAADPVPVLHDADNSHPTLAGSYLAACCFQWTLFGAPVGEPAATQGILQAEREALHTAARDVCRERAAVG
ncbi:MAG: hypothetical protein CME04_11690 [Gemmatimonadaceae bacterium]|jgi:hypothetical protein|nr:hypothetical protein [Gemmatimonadaceae bacterium]|tara:strand:- start:463 stop:1125 length:663 start_codon:yes stop_codon:yes gene_type:complete